jgi:1,4-alpha-glucan branching enzyme
VRLSVAAAALLMVALGLGIGIGVRNSDTVNVRFVLDAPEARTVELAANFTNWETSGYSLRRVTPGGQWELRVTLQKGSLYSYNFVIDGELWIPDPSIPEKVDDGFGGASSLLRL